MNDQYTTYKPPGVPLTAGTPGHNEHGYPLHACNGYRHDEHYWAWLKHRREARQMAAEMCRGVVGEVAS